MGDIGLFFKYLASFDELKNIKSIVKKPIYWVAIALSGGVVSSVYKKFWLTVLCLILALVFSGIGEYKSGRHRFWYKEKLRKKVMEKVE